MNKYINKYNQQEKCLLSSVGVALVSQWPWSLTIVLCPQWASLQVKQLWWFWRADFRILRRSRLKAIQPQAALSWETNRALIGPHRYNWLIDILFGFIGFHPSAGRSVVCWITQKVWISTKPIVRAGKGPKLILAADLKKGVDPGVYWARVFHHISIMSQQIIHEAWENSSICRIRVRVSVGPKLKLYWRGRTLFTPNKWLSLPADESLLSHSWSKKIKHLRYPHRPAAEEETGQIWEWL